MSEVRDLGLDATITRKDFLNTTLLGLGGAYGASRALEIRFVFNPVVVVTAFSFSAAVGVIFGFFPARKAARMNPIDALRHE